MNIIFAILCVFTFGVAARAEPLTPFPGWSLSKIPVEAAEDGSYELGPEFFALKPPDARPAVTIDGRTAKALRAGQGNPLDIYQKKTARAETEGEEFVYTSANNGFAKQAENENSSGSSGVVGVAVNSGQSRASSGSSSGGFSGASSFPASGAIRSAATANETYGSAASGAGGAGAGAGAAAASRTPIAGEGAQVTAVRDTQRPTGLAKTEEDLVYGANASSSVAKGVGKIAAGNTSVGEDEVGSAVAGRAPSSGEVAKPTSKVGSGVQGNTRPQGLGFKTEKEKQKEATAERKRIELENSGNSDLTGKDFPERPVPCISGKRIFEEPGIIRLKLQKSCGLVYVSAWGGGGGNGLRTAGGGAAFVNGSGKIDSAKYDLLVVVGAAGGQAEADGPGLGGYPGGGRGGTAPNASGGGGGGYSGVFLVEKSVEEHTIHADKALGVAGGGGGGSGRGQNGDAGGANAGGAKGNGSGGGELQGGDGGGGLPHPACQSNQNLSSTVGAEPTTCSIVTYEGGEGGSSTQQVARDFDSAGGGGGGGGLQGGGGGAGAHAEQSASGGSGGSSEAKMENNIVEGGNGVNTGFHYYPDRGDAGSPGRHGKVIVQYF